MENIVRSYKQYPSLVTKITGDTFTEVDLGFEGDDILTRGNFTKGIVTYNDGRIAF
jgi:hypothetical protein